jgi:glycine hydroxymethyltransferase
MPDPVVAIAYRSALEVISAAEPDVAKAIVGELESQRRQLKLIASENYASPAVLLAMGNWLSDKYAEGTPGHRFYAGCEMVDRIETLATDHAKVLFGPSTPTSNLTRGSTPTWSPTGPSLPTESSSPSSTRLEWVT